MKVIPMNYEVTNGMNTPEENSKLVECSICKHQFIIPNDISEDETEFVCEACDKSSEKTVPVNDEVFTASQQTINAALGD